MPINKCAIDTAVSAYGDQAQVFVRLTLNDADLFMTDIEAALARADCLQAGWIAHSLKSLMRQVGEERMGMIAQELESAGKAGNLHTCRIAQEQLTAAYAIARPYLLVLS